jgi:branched-chain amino acid transport system permease protein
VLLILVTLALAPFLFPGARGISVAAKILVFVLLVASYDLLLGSTGDTEVSLRIVMARCKT